MHTLYQVVLKMVLFIVAPHYVLIVALNYWARPIFAEMILKFKNQKKEHS